jgi:hypothetical protein
LALLGLRCAEQRISRIEYSVKFRLLFLVGSKDRAKQRLELFGLALALKLFEQPEKAQALLDAYIEPMALQLGNQIVERQWDPHVQKKSLWWDACRYLALQ